MGKTIILLLVVCMLIGASVSTPLMATEAGPKSFGMTQGAAHRGPPPSGGGGGGGAGGSGGPPPPPTTEASSR